MLFAAVRQRPGGIDCAGLGDGARAETSMTKHYLLASDFDQTLSFNDSGIVLSELLGMGGFEEKVAGLSRLHFVQQGAELAYLLRHDPEYRRVRREHLIDVGRRIRLKRNVALLAKLLEAGIDDCRFHFFVVSAAPEEVVQSALREIQPPERIVGARFTYDSETGEIASITRVPAGYGKVAAVDALQRSLGIPSDHVAYVGDGGSDVHVMLHVNHGGGFTIAASESASIAQIARRTVVSDDALSVLVPILEDVVGWTPSRIRALFETNGVVIHEWAKMRTDRLTIRERGGLDGVPVSSAT